MKTTNMRKDINLSVFQTFLIPIVLGWICSVFTLIFTQGQAWDGTIFQYGNDRFMDFFNHIFYSSDIQSTYTWTYHACFPPFAYLFYHLLSMLLPKDTVYMWQSSLTGSYGLLIYILFVAISLLLMCYMISKICNNLSEEKRFLITIIFSLSFGTVVGCIERGNNVIYVCILLLAAILFKDSSHKIKRELALLFIAMAAALKVYPAIFGLLYLYEKRWKEAARLILYGILFFFVPFIWVGGFDGFKLFLSNQSTLQLSSITEAGFSSIGAIVRFFTTNEVIVTATALLCMLLFIVLAKIQTTPWKRYLLLLTCMTFVPLWSGTYTLVYFVIALLFFLKDSNKKITGLNGYYSLIFGMIFSFALIPYKSHLVSWPRFICYLGAYSLVILVCCDTIYTIIKRKKQK